MSKTLSHAAESPIISTWNPSKIQLHWYQVDATISLYGRCVMSCTCIGALRTHYSISGPYTLHDGTRISRSRRPKDYHPGELSYLPRETPDLATAESARAVGSIPPLVLRNGVASGPEVGHAAFRSAGTGCSRFRQRSVSGAVSAYARARRCPILT
eukprot:185273-Rhodomonas_salina.1